MSKNNKLVVMKFGGSSVANVDKIKHVTNRVINKHNEGYKVVVVVSAPGDMTDDLCKKAYKITAKPDHREMDRLLSTGEQVSISLLSMSIKSLGYKSISLTGPQVGIVTDTVHTKAKIKKIHTHKLESELKKNDIIIVAGFQGINVSDDITTLGRGGSDLTAVALAAVLKCDCEIYTDVLGVYTADPRIVSDARKLDKIYYDEMLELAGLGAQVMQARSIEVAKKYNVSIHVRSTFDESIGTYILGEESFMEDLLISGVASDKDQVKFSINGIPDHPGVAADMFYKLGNKGVNVDMIVQSAAQDSKNDIAFTAHVQDFDKTLEILNELKVELGAKDVLFDKDVAKVSIVGVGMKSHTGVAARMFEVMSKNNINIQMISTSEIKISCIIDIKDADTAVRKIHKTFEL